VRALKVLEGMAVGRPGFATSHGRLVNLNGNLRRKKVKCDGHRRAASWRVEISEVGRQRDVALGPA